MKSKWGISFLRTRGIEFVCLTGAVCSTLGFVSGSIWKLPVGVLGASYICFTVSLCIIVIWEGRNRAKIELEMRSLERGVELIKKDSEQESDKLENRTKGLEDRYDALEGCFDSLHDIYHSLRDNYCLLDNGTGPFTVAQNELFLKELTSVLDKIRDLFRQAYNIRCSVCIKLITDKTKLEVMTLKRDSKSTRERTQQDAVPSYVQEHFAFRTVIVDRNRYFFSTNFVADEKKGNFWGRAKWQKHYKSGAVLPIKKDAETMVGDSKESMPEYLGFLCLDTKRKNVLSEDFTVWTLAGIADILYIVCKRYGRLIGENGNSKEQEQEIDGS